MLLCFNAAGICMIFLPTSKKSAVFQLRIEAPIIVRLLVDTMVCDIDRLLP